MKLGIAGCTGRMGLALLKAAAETDGVSVAAGSIRPDKPVPDREFWLASGIREVVPVVKTVEALVSAVDVVIDYTAPATTLAIAEQAAASGKLLVSGTTGLTEEQFRQLHRYAERIPIVWASNTSVGVALLTTLVKEAAAKLDDAYDIEIVEMHHRNKVDAPSGTALGLGRAAAEGRGVVFDAVATLSREGYTGVRPRGEIGFATLRGGEVIGDHTVIFSGPGERIELTHKSSSRAIYAHGAIRAAHWLMGRQAGFYSMQDILK